MKIASYNIFDGMHNSIPQLEEFVKTQELDVLCLQEANEWLDGDYSILDKFAATTGLVNVVSGGNSRFKIATLSRLPFVHTDTHTDKFWHGAIETEIDTSNGVIDVWNTHLKAYPVGQRTPEMEYIASQIDTSKPNLVVGDFNSISRADKLPEDFAQKFFEMTEQNKFGQLHNNYDVTDILPRKGVYDIAAILRAAEYTVPTPASKDKAHNAVREILGDGLRVDFMFGTSSLIKMVKGYSVPKTDVTHAISDHYPQILTLE